MIVTEVDRKEQASNQGPSLKSCTHLYSGSGACPHAYFIRCREPGIEEPDVRREALVPSFRGTRITEM